MSNIQSTKQLVAKTEIRTVFDFLEQKRDLIAKALPNTITPDRLIGIFTMILRGSPELTQCTQTSLIAAVVQTVQLGLQPGNIGHVYLIPFNNKQKDGTYKKEVQLLVGYRGLCQLVNNSKDAVVLTAEVVKQNDEFEFEFGLNPLLRHVPAQGDRGEIIGSYAIAKNLLANEKVFVYLQKDELDKVKASSKAGSSDFSPWNTWPEEMCKKTAVKRLCKLLPLSSETQKKIGADETIRTRIEPGMVDLPDNTEWQGETIEANKEKEPDTQLPEATKQPLNEPPAHEQPQKAQDPSLISIPQQKRLYAIAREAEITDFKEWLFYNFHIEHIRDISKSAYELICKTAEKGMKDNEKAV
jgi:recombination protein RecT